MKAHSTDTVPFIPARLNKRPTVYRGMTLSELMIVILIGLGIGIPVGLILMFLLDGLLGGGIAWIPTGIVLVELAIVPFGGRYIARLKRGKPENWLERQIELKKSPGKFITTANHWSIKRSSRPNKVKNNE